MIRVKKGGCEEVNGKGEG